jgi:transcriptional regulator with XRE-family HTH domain
MNVRDFLKANSLKQVALARYLGITEAAISNVVKEKSEFSKENLIKIMNNPYGWDTSMLESQPQPELTTDVIPQYSNTELLLRELLAEKEAKIDALNEIIWELKAENARLAEQLRIKGGDVVNAEDSLSASA